MTKLLYEGKDLINTSYYAQKELSTFTVDQAGYYYVGVKNTSTENSGYIAIDDITIQKNQIMASALAMVTQPTSLTLKITMVSGIAITPLQISVNGQRLPTIRALTIASANTMIGAAS